MFKVNEIIKATSGKLIQGKLSYKLEGISTDSRMINPKEAFLALKGNNFNGHSYIEDVLKLGVVGLIVENIPECSIPKEIIIIQVKDTTLALGDIARFQRKKINLPVIAVTGSNGKTTTKDMIAWVLSAKGQVLKTQGTKNNQVGLPQTLLRLTPEDGFGVVEMGTNHFGEIDYLAKIASANIGVITNIGLSHIEFLKDLNGVLKEKSTLLDNLIKPGLAVLCSDDKMLKRIILSKDIKESIFTYGINEKSDFNASAIKFSNGKLEFKVNAKYDFALSTIGYHNIYNALAAITVARLLGLGYSEIAERLANFQFPKGRLNFIEFKGLNFIDDTYNSNPLSLEVALASLNTLKCSGKKVFVMGNMLELGNQKELLHRQIARSITSICDIFVAVGNLAALTAQEALELGFKSQNVFCCANAQVAGDLLYSKLSLNASDIILVKGSRSMKMEEVFKV